MSCECLANDSISHHDVGGYRVFYEDCVDVAYAPLERGVGVHNAVPAVTLSLTNTSTQNTQLYETVNSSITSSFSAIQASFISSGTNYNTLALNPNGGNVGIGTSAPAATLHVSGTGILTSGIRSNMYNILTSTTTLTVSQMGGVIECGGSSAYTVTLPSPAGGASATNGYMSFQAWMNTTYAITFSTPFGLFYGQCGNSAATMIIPNASGQLVTFASDGYNWGVWMSPSVNSSGNFGVGTSAPGYPLSVGTTYGVMTSGTFTLAGTSSVDTGYVLPAGGLYQVNVTTNSATGPGGGNYHWWWYGMVNFNNASYVGAPTVFSNNNANVAVATNGHVTVSTPGGSGSFSWIISAVRVC